MTHSSSSPAPSATGGCLCGAVRYEVRGPLRDVYNCHCTTCGRVHGHYAAYSAAARAALVISEDRGLRWYDSSSYARRGFCADCGASLFFEPRERDETAIAAGSLDQPTGLKTVGHIYVADKADYYDIADDLERWLGSRGGG